MAKTRRKKKRTHKVLEEDTVKKVPKSFVLRRGKLSRLLRHLEKDIRTVMLPHTAAKLKESKRNNLKDFLHVAGPLGVSHFLMLSATTKAAYLRVAKTPRGPTLTFKIHSYALAGDLASVQTRYRSPLTIFKNPPLVVLNNFAGEESHLKLVTVMFQNLFPAINVKTIQLSQCQRVLLLNYDPETELISFRHYAVSAQPTGVSRSVRKLVQGKAVPNLGNLEDVSEFVTKAGYGSESEAEDEASKVTLAQDLGRGNRALNRSAVKLHEVGPRMELQLVKVEEGLSEGKVLYHHFVHKSEEEAERLEQKVKSREELRAQRRRQQEENVKRKQSLQEAKDPEVAKKQAERQKKWEERKQDEEEQAEDDAEWYRKEVGEEPEAELMRPARKSLTDRKRERYWERRNKEDEMPAAAEDGEGPRKKLRSGDEEGRSRRVDKFAGAKGGPRKEKRGGFARGSGGAKRGGMNRGAGSQQRGKGPQRGRKG